MLKLDSVLDELSTQYTPPDSFLHFRTELDLLVATLLSAQCTDERVNQVTATIIYPKYNTSEDYIAVPREELEQDVHSCGTFRMKAKHIQELCQILIDQHGGNVPQTMEELTALPGIGRKTASILLYVLFGKTEGIAVDTHVLRLAQRMGFTNGKTADRAEKDLMEQSDKKQWGPMNKLLISHGRAVCTALNRNCENCVFKDDCPSSSTTGKGDIYLELKPKTKA